MSDQQEFQRQRRYLVFKITDLYKPGMAEVRSTLEELCTQIDQSRRSAAKNPLECLVIESDWPEYETAWKMIEERCTGKPLTCDASAADRLAALELQLRIKHGFMQKARHERNTLEALVNKLMTEAAESRMVVQRQRALLQEAVNLCAIGDIDETTEEPGWSSFVTDAKAVIKQ